MDISVIICTYNRAEQLRRTLDGFCSLSVPSTVNWQLIVVDNNSTDGTRDVCAEFASSAVVGAASPPRFAGPGRGGDAAPTSGGEKSFPLRYLFEPQQGKSRALNRALTETDAPLLLFTDDDVDVDAQWLVSYHAAMARHPDAAFFGGPIYPRWEAPPPRWLAENSSGLLDGVMVHVDKGEAERVIGPADKWFFGANMAFRRQVFDEGLRFREDIGLADGPAVRGEDTELQKQLLTSGQIGVYVPAAVVHHRNPPERMTERYVRAWFKGQGMKRVRLGAMVASNHYWAGAPRHLWRRCLTAGARYVATRWTCPARVWLTAEIEMARTWGMITEIRTRSGTGVSPVQTTTINGRDARSTIK